MNRIGPLLTRENLLSYSKDSAEELQKEKTTLRNLERILKQLEFWSPDFWNTLGLVYRARERVKAAEEALAVYQEQLDFLSIG